MEDIQQAGVKTLRFLAVDQVEQARSGHPGLPLGAAPLLYCLWDRFLRYNPQAPSWLNRDRFILSPGHGSALLYAMLHLAGYDLSLEELKQFRQWGSRTPGHPEYGLTPGVDASTGPLGHGFAMGVGMAIAEALLAATYNRPGYPIIDHYTYGLTSDGDLMEGVASEAASLAGTLGLGKLIYLYDDNKITIEGSTAATFAEDVGRRFAAYQWQVLRVEDSEDLDALAAAIKEAQADAEHPSLIIVRTHIGYGSPKVDDASCHGEPLGAAALAATKEKAGWPQQPFYVPEAVREHFAAKAEAGAAQEAAWQQLVAGYKARYPELAAELAQRLHGPYELDLEALADLFKGKEKAATRAASGDILQLAAQQLPALIGGSADLGPSNKTVLKASPYFSKTERTGRNIHFGVREHGMGAALNGLALHGGCLPYGGTFLVFADFLRPAIRMAALMGLGSIFVLTHDSIALGEDGPTHQPIETAMGLRLLPNVKVYRPADALETAVAYREACADRKGPSCLLLSRQNLPVLNQYREVVLAGAAKGGYVLREAEGEARACLIATGSEVHLALAAQAALQAEGLGVRVVSLPCWELFAQQEAAYQAAVLPKELPKLALEAGATLGWERYTGSPDRVLGIDRFGASAPGDVLLAKFGFTVDRVVAKVKEILDI